MRANMLDVAAARPRVWRTLLMVVAVAPALSVSSSTTTAPTPAPIEAPQAVARPEPPPPPPQPRTLPSGAPACGNVTSRAPRPRDCGAGEL